MAGGQTKLSALDIRASLCSNRWWRLVQVLVCSNHREKKGPMNLFARVT